MNLSQNAKIKRVLNGVAVGTTAQNTTAVDMQNVDSVCFFVAVGDITASCAPVITVQAGAQSDGSDAAAIIPATSVTLADTDDNKVVVIEVKRPRSRYVRLNITRTGGTGCVLDGVIAVSSLIRKAPATVDSTVKSHTVVVPTA